MKNFFDTLKHPKDKAMAIVDEIANSSLASAASEKIMKVANHGVAFAAEGYERTGTKLAVERVGEKLDDVSGKTILEEVRKLVAVQSVYNDVLATKLQEALDRVAALEAKTNKE